MAIEKKSLVSKKTPTTKSMKSKVDTGKPATGKVVTAFTAPVLKHKG